MIFGNFEVFAIELDENLINNKLAKLRLFINAQPIGTFDTIGMIGSFIHIMKHIISNAEKNILWDPLFDDLTDAQIFDEVFSEKNIENFSFDNSRFLVGLGDTFDDFSIMVCSNDIKNIRFIWQLVEQPFFEYSSYPIGVLAATVPIQLLKECIESLEKWLVANTTE